MVTHPIKVVLVENNREHRQTYFRYLNEYEEINAVCVADSKELFLQLEKEIPDIAIFDISMVNMNGYEALNIFKTIFPSIKSIVISSTYLNPLISQFKAAGACAFLPNKNLDLLRETISAIVHSKFYYYDAQSLNINKLVFEEIIPKVIIQNQVKLTRREGEVLQLIFNGVPYKNIAIELGICLDTVKYHAKNIHLKTQQRSMAGLIKYAQNSKEIIK